MDDMLLTMYEAPGIGLAAVQVGILKRVIVIDISKDDQKKSQLFLVNPKITHKSKKLHLRGRLSFFTRTFCRNRETI